MELTKVQIQSINNILEEKGVKFWDVRLEMVDHIANSIESKLTENDNFNDAVLESMSSLGYNGSFYNVITAKQKQIQKEFSKKNNKELIGFFKNYKTFIPYLIFTAVGLTQLENRFFFKVALMTPIIILGFQLIFSFFNYKKVYKSIYLLSSTIGISFATSLSSLLIYIPKVFTNDDFVIPNWYFLTVCAITFPLIYASLKVFFDTYKKYDFTALRN